MLLSSIQDVKRYVIVGADLTMESFGPAIRSAQEKYIVPFLGRKLLKFLEDNSYDDGNQDLIDLVCAATAKFALALYVAPGGVQVDDAGLYKLKTDNMWRLSKEETDELKFAYLEEGMDALDTLLEYLEENVEAVPDDLEESNYTALQWWAKSKVHQRLGALFVKTPEAFDEHVSLFRSNLTFLSLLPCIGKVEKHQVAKMMGDYWNTFLSATNVDNSLIELTTEAIVRGAATMALSEGVFYLYETRLGVRLQNTDKIPEETIQEYKKQANDALERLRAKLEQLKPTGYTSISIDNTVLRKFGTKLILS